MLSVVLAACCLVSGQVNASSGAPLADAHIVAHRSESKNATSDASGKFTLDLPPGDYQVDVSARGYASVSVDLKVDHDTAMAVTLEPLDLGSLRVIGSVSIDGRLTPIRGTIPSVSKTRSDYDRLGMTGVTDGLMTIPSVTFAHPGGGQQTGYQTIALRGPDPSETLVALDGQLLNDGNTGDIDLSRFPIEAFSAVNVTEGLGPQDSNGANTIGGELNLSSLHPTKDSKFTFGETIGSFGETDFWANDTGSRGKLGYAAAVDDQHFGGFVNEFKTVYANPSDLTTGSIVRIGSKIASRSALANLSWTFNQNTDITARVFAMSDVRDNSSAINGIDYNATDAAFGQFIGPGNQTISQNIRAYQLRGRTALGAGELVGELSTDNDSVNLSGGVFSAMYDVTHQDTRTNGALEWQRTFDTGDYALGGYSRYETLRFQDPLGNLPGINQTIWNLHARGSMQAGKELKLSGALFESHYTSFGSSLDWRAGANYDLGPSTSLRASVGTGFRAPLLIERYLFDPTVAGELTQDAKGVFVGQGNPNEQPEHATEFELGASHRFSPDATLDVSLYRTNLRNPIENYYPYALAQTGACGAQTPAVIIPGCVSFPINIGNVVYQGAEVKFSQKFEREHLFLQAMYGLNVAYPFNLGSTISNPTSGGNLVNNQQFLGIPQQQGSLELDWAKGDWHAGTIASFRGNNNELNQTPFTTMNIAVGTKINPVMDVTLVGTNILSGGAGRYTGLGGGVPYRGIVGVNPTVYGPLATDRYVTEPFGVKLVMTMKY